MGYSSAFEWPNLSPYCSNSDSLPGEDESGQCCTGTSIRPAAPLSKPLITDTYSDDSWSRRAPLPSCAGTTRSEWFVSCEAARRMWRRLHPASSCRECCNAGVSRRNAKLEGSLSNSQPLALSLHLLPASLLPLLPCFHLFFSSIILCYSILSGLSFCSSIHTHTHTHPYMRSFIGIRHSFP